MIELSWTSTLRTGSPSPRACSTTTIPAAFHATVLRAISASADVEMTIPPPQNLSRPQPLFHTTLSRMVAPSDISNNTPVSRLSWTRLAANVTSTQEMSHHSPAPVLLSTSFPVI